MMGAKTEVGSFVGDRGKPKYSRGKASCEHVTAVAISEVNAYSEWIGTYAVLQKLIERTVTRAKSSRNALG